jgi:hypothetical protein
MRIAVLAIALVFIGLLAFLTIKDLVDHGVTFAAIAGLFIIVLFSIGIVGALRHPPEQ